MFKIEHCQYKTDEEIAILTLEDRNFFLCLIKRYEDKLLRYILRISNFTKEEAEDNLQEVFIKIYTNLNDFDQSLKFSSWVYRITHNQVISHYRKKQSRPKDAVLDVDVDILNQIASDLDINKGVDLEYLKKNIYNILNSLDVKYREVLVLKFLEDKDYKEISDIIKKPMGTVATLINRAKQKFKQETKKQNINLK
ncbi:sigma-70 family RNA polymerase sigma factor [Patescibacteria group bacterium]|nr:sigma-70 family RNA polymerase sigma factor [Patescibacteria group bacterium]